jgi:HSP20 family molecular chaperone IbpA
LRDTGPSEGIGEEGDRLVSAIKVRNYPETKGEALPLLDEIEQIHAAIRRKAHELFEHRQPSLESDLDNWLAAERQVLCVPASELSDDGKRYLLRAALPGMKPEQIQVTALPDMLILEGEAHNTTRKQTDGVVFSEFNQEKVLRRFDLSDKIDVEKVEAHLRNGILEVTATKASGKTRKRKAGPRVARNGVSHKPAASEKSKPGRKDPGKRSK